MLKITGSGPYASRPKPLCARHGDALFPDRSWFCLGGEQEPELQAQGTGQFLRTSEPPASQGCSWVVPRERQSQCKHPGGAEAKNVHGALVQERWPCWSSLGDLPKAEGTDERPGGCLCADLSVARESIAVVCFPGEGAHLQHYHLGHHLDITEPGSAERGAEKLENPCKLDSAFVSPSPAAQGASQARG